MKMKSTAETVVTSVKASMIDCERVSSSEEPTRTTVTNRPQAGTPLRVRRPKPSEAMPLWARP